MWNHQFQYLLHIPLRKIINVFHHINDNSDVQHCTSNQNYSIIMTSRLNAMCEYLNNPRMLNVIGFQSQDIQNYVNAYFKNSNEASVLMKKLNNNRSVKLLGHIPLQDKSNNEKWEEMTFSKLYETLLKSYMKWNWMKSNGLNNKLNDNKIFKIFEMEMDYYLKLRGKIKMWTTNHFL
ncbi:hypothetical protein RFI_38384 [Reticulomyxa filosa]|uniref:Uncharacterized protein n=1 Tax=Reticulomyxa filosa TaxID=46433 RepID=X6LC30_RETFI|nr:hypothetical protein RFI_38384 [Reticulomyxa filosa]|eukprot:ETN99103.1 hypothetical protein RFI_38384 [Reticulomyxa filosa]